MRKIMRTLTITFLLVCAIFAQASVRDKNFGSVVVDEVTSIYDGDTFRVNISGWPDIIGERVMIRINGIDAPELRGKCEKEKKWALRAKQFVVEKLRHAGKIVLKNMHRGKYFRIIADVYVDGVNLGKEMIMHGLAVEYHGGHKKMDWCK